MIVLGDYVAASSASFQDVNRPDSSGITPAIRVSMSAVHTPRDRWRSTKPQVR
jgi:hypothetical protein